MNDKKFTDTESRDGIDVHPNHDSWVRIANHNWVVNFVIFLVLFALFVLVISLHFNPVALASVGVLATLALLWFVWRSALQRRGGFLGKAGLTARIKADLVTELGANHVDVDSAKGVVTLRGSVPYSNFRESAVILARRQGAHAVVNELIVAPTASERADPYLQDFPGVTTPEGVPEVATHAPLDVMVREALEADQRVHSHVLIVNVADGIAYLTGRQETVQASDAATEVAIHVPGILGVSNDIEILTSV